MVETRNLDVFWTVQRETRWSIALTEEDAWSSLTTLAAFDEDPHGWSVERAREKVPLAAGELIEGDGEAIELDGTGHEQSRRTVRPLHVFWDCPHCGRQRNTSLFEDPSDRKSPARSPSLWFCQQGNSLVLVHW